MRMSSRASGRARSGCARSPARRSSCSASTVPRCCAARSRSRTSSRSSGWRRSRRRSVRREEDRRSVSPLTTDEIHEKYLQKAISEINELAHEIAQAAGELRVPVVGTGHPLADIMLVKYRPRPTEAQEGVAFYGRSGTALIKSLQRLRVDPLAVYGTNCLKFADGDEDECRPWLTREL